MNNKKNIFTFELPCNDKRFEKMYEEYKKIAMNKKAKLERQVEWFKSIYKDIMDAEDWRIYQYPQNTHRKTQFKIVGFSFSYNPNIEAYKIAKQYGWVLDKDGYIIKYDTNKHIKNKHLITGTELGLL